MATDEVTQILDVEPAEYWEQNPGAHGLPVALAERFRRIVLQRGATVLEQAFAVLEPHLRRAAEEARGLHDIPPIAPTVMREIERWNVAGVAMLVPELAPLGQVVYERLLSRIRELQETIDARLHKGTPYHMLGWTRLLQNDPRSARDYFRLAAFEDSLIEDVWQAAPAGRFLAENWQSDSDLGWIANLGRRAETTNEAWRQLFIRNPELLMLQLVQEAG